MSPLTYLAKYFDLRDPYPFKATTNVPSTHTPASAKPTPPGPAPASGAQLPSVTRQVATYLLVVVSRFCDLYRAGALETFKLDVPYLLFLGIVSLIVFPVVYNKTTISPDSPALIRIALIFTAGMGWGKIFSSTVGK